MNNLKLEYNPEEDSSVGFYRCPECRSEFFGGGRAIHRSTCTREGYDGITHVFGEKYIEKVVRYAKNCGDDDSNFWGVSLNDLRREFPDVLTTFVNP